MPAIPQQTQAEAPLENPADANANADATGSGSQPPADTGVEDDAARGIAAANNIPDLQPAPAVIDVSSHVDVHVLPRRFLGPMPQSIATSEQTQQRRLRLRTLRRKGMSKLLGGRGGVAGIQRDLERGLVMDDGEDGEGEGRKRHRFRVHRRDKLNVAHDVDFDVNESDSDSSSGSSEEEGAGWFGGGGGRKDTDKDMKKDKKDKRKKKDKKDKNGKDKKNKSDKKKKKKKKDKQFRVWVGGDGFDIGREFKTASGTGDPDAAVAGNPDVSREQVDKADVLADEIDAMDEQDNNETLRDELWSSVGVPERSAAEFGSGSPPRSGTDAKGKGKETKDDKESLVTAKTKPVVRDYALGVPAAPPAPASPPTPTPAPSSPAPTSTPAPPQQPHDKHVPSSYSSSVGDSFFSAVSDRGDVSTLSGSFDPSAEADPSPSSEAKTDMPSTPQRLNPAFAVGLPGVLQRPNVSRTSTMETFRTAREHGGDNHDDGHGHDDSDTDSFFASAHLPHAVPIAPSPLYGSEATSSPPRGGGGSTRPLLGASDDEGAVVVGGKRSGGDTTPRHLRRMRSSISSISGSSLRAFPQRLKSAMRVPSASASPSAVPQPSPKAPVKTVTWTSTDDKGKFKIPLIRTESSTPISPILGVGALKPSASKKRPKSPQEPADPADVLRRTGSEIAGTSTEAQEDATVIDDDDFMPGGVVMRDRILVKVGRHRDENMSSFDEAFQRRDPCFRYEPMEEYLVGMTMTSVDFYSDWTFQCQETWTGYKRLRYSIPMGPPTRICVFNPRDMMLCLLCPWSTVSRHTQRHHELSKRMNGKAAWNKVKHSRPVEGLNLDWGRMGVFLLKFGERSRALDWHWYISGQLDYRLPKQIDVRLPAMGQTIRMAIPEEAASSTVNTESTLKLLWGSVISNSSHREILRNLGTLPRIELAWKGPDATLDWVSYSTTVTGRNREWALLASFAQALQAGKRAMLQARMARHRALRVILEDKTSMDEPVGLEGYLVWHRAGTGPKELVYISSNEGLVFVAPAAAGVPPLLPKREGSTPADLFPDVHRSFLTAEKRRMSRFIEKCTGCIDLRDIAAVELRKSPTDAVDPTASPPTSPRSDAAHHVSAHKVVPKQGEKKDREFIVKFRNGHTATFEAHTPAVAAEWVDHMSQLATYWGLYHRVVARQDMDVAHLHAKTLSGFDSHSEELLNNVWNWCVIDGCRTITMCGPIFVKRGRYRKFKAVFMTITGGSLVTFRIVGSAGLQPRRHVWPLFGAYIYSGMLAQDELRETVNEMAFSPSARMYSDGLRSTDGAEDTTFCVRITWPTGAFAAPQPWDKESDAEETDVPFVPPRLSQAPSQLLICRARSRLERDRWIWAINAEKERCSRTHVHSEEKLRNTGNLPRFSSLMHIDGTADSRPAFTWRNSSRTSLSSA